MLQNKNLFPDGVEDLYGDDYEFKEETIKDITNVFKSFGYHQLITPTIEYYDLYSKIDNPLAKESMFKLIDKDGKILVLRPDGTIPVARMAALNYKNTNDYLKFFYITNIFRMHNEKDGKREFVQGGIEFLGNSKVECDGEIIAMAIKCLIVCGLKDFHIDIGQVQFLESLLSEIDINKFEKEKLFRLIENKNYGDLKVFLKTLDIPAKHKDVILKIPRLYGEPEKVILLAQNLTLNDEMKEALFNLMSVYNILKSYRLDKYIYFDLGFTKTLGYYTGIIFKGYMNQYGEMILSGGRYDKLTEYFGSYKPACGFGININKLVEVMKMFNIKKEKENLTDYLILYKDAFRDKAIELAENLRFKGFTVESDSYELSIKSYIDSSIRKTKEIIEVEKDYIKVIDVYKNKINRYSINQYIKTLDTENILASIH